MGFFDEKKKVHFEIVGKMQYPTASYIDLCEFSYIFEGYASMGVITLFKYTKSLSQRINLFSTITENLSLTFTEKYQFYRDGKINGSEYNKTKTLYSKGRDFTYCNEQVNENGEGYKKFSDILPNIQEKWNECIGENKSIREIEAFPATNLNNFMQNFINETTSENYEKYGFSYDLNIFNDNECPIYCNFGVGKIINRQEIEFRSVSTIDTVEFSGISFTPHNTLINFATSYRYYPLMYLLSDLGKYKGITVDYKNEDNNTTPYYPNSSFISKYKDVPTLILQSKSGITIGGITGFTDLVYKKSLNSANELNFNFYKYLDGEINPLWEEMKDLKTVYIPEFEEKFQIEISYTDDEMETKVITGTALCEAELSQIIIRGLEINTEDDMKYSSTSTYQITKFYDPVDTNHSLLHRVLKTKANHYTIGHVDDTLCNLAFEFTADETDIYSFLTDEVAKKCECLFLFDSMTRTINAYDLCSTCQDCYEDVIGSISRHYRGDFVDICPNCGSTNVVNGYGKDTTILIDKENLANSITKESDVGSLKNCLYVEGGDENINAAFILSNPNGSQYIYYFSPETLEDMGEPLSTAITEYTEKCELYKTSHAIDASTTRHVYFESEDKMINNDTSDNGGTDNIYVDNYNTTVQLISNLSTDASFQNFEENKKDGYIFTGQSELVKELYNAMDLETFIQTSMMPEYSINKYDKYTALSLLTQENFGTLAIAYLSKTITNTSVSNTIEAKAKTLIDTSKYKVSIFNGSFTYDEESNIVTWTGTFQITDRLDDDDTTNTITNSNYLSIATDVEKLSNDKILEISSLGIPSTVTVYINDNFVEYTKNSVEATIAKEDLQTTTNICSCTISLTEFMNEIDLYSIDNLKIFYNVIQSCCEVLSSKLSDLTESSVGYSEIKKMYDDYFIKLKLITGYIELREEDLLSVKQYRLLMSAYINEVAEELNFQTFLENYSDTQNLWEIFNYYRREDTYKNDNIISDNLETNEELLEYAGWLMTYAKKELLKMGTPQYAISTDLNNLLALPEFKPIIEDFEVGNWIHIRTDVRDDIEEEIIYKLRLLSYQINFDEIQSIDVEFSNVVRTIDCMSDMKSILDSAQSMATSYNSVYKEVDKSKETNEIVSTWVNDSLDLTNQLIKTEGNDQSITIDEHGILARKCDTLTREYDSHQLKIFSNGLYFTPDNWETIKAGVGKFVYKDPTRNFVETIGYGVIADTIVSNIVCTSELGIYNESGSVKIDGDGIYITDGELCIGDENDTSKPYAKITSDGVLYARDGVFTGKIEGGTIDINGKFKVDKYGNVTLPVGTKISWEDVNGISENVTTITNNAISTTDVLAENLKVNVVNIQGKLTAEQIDTTGLIAENISSTTIDGKTISGGNIINEYSDYITEIKNGQIYSHTISLKQVASGLVPAIYLENLEGTAKVNSILFEEDLITFGSAIECEKITCTSVWTTESFNVEGDDNGLHSEHGWLIRNNIVSDEIVVAVGSTKRDTRIYGTNIYQGGSSTTITSDERIKEDFNTLEQYEDLFFCLKPVSYKYKNGTSSRTHIGIVGQDVKEALHNNNLTTDDFAGYVEFPTDEECMPYIQDTIMCGVRLDEFVMLNTHMIQKLYSVIESQKQEIDKLKEKFEEMA